MKENIEIDKNLCFYQRSLGKSIFAQNPERYNIFMPKTINGIKRLEKFDEIYFYKQLELSNRELNIEKYIRTSNYLNFSNYI